MNLSQKKQIACFGVSLVLMVSILMPSIIKLHHGLFDHVQEECTNAGTVHLHQVELDCDFHKHQITTSFYPSLVNYALPCSIPEKESSYNYYSFVSGCTLLHFSLRAPPAV